MKVFPLYEGSYSVDITKKFIPFDPAVHSYKDRPGSLFVYVQPFLIETSNNLIVIDTGLGFKTANGEALIHENIRKAGYDPQDVNLVLMSHLHFDHSAGMVYEKNGKRQLAFPNAEYVINRGEWESAYSSPSKSYRTEIFDIVLRSGSIHFIEGAGRFNDQITYEVTGGHCEYHQVFLLEDGEEKVFFGGDILPEPEQLLRKFKAKYDFDPTKAMEQREHYGKLAAENDWLCLFYHAKSQATGKVAMQGDAFTII